MSIKEYRQKRRLNKTPEPDQAPVHEYTGNHLIFVVQKHSARNLHYDLRLELEGVLKSFAIPKGPSLDPSLKRLAVQVEDHPFDYRDFEGVIPEGNYGAGSVIIWDRGFYSSLDSADKKESEKILLNGFKKGDLKFILAGEKLKGEFVLVRTKLNNDSWLLIKKKDKYASTVNVLEQARSVVSGRTIEEIAEEIKSESSEENGSGHGSIQRKKEYPEIEDAPPEAMPHSVKPMLSGRALKPFNNPDWIFEIKWDGYRAVAEISGRNVSLHSRNNKTFNKKFPEIVETLKQLKLKAVLDGEVIFMGSNGKPDFQMLHDYQGGAANKKSKGRLIYYVFDILHYNNRRLTGLDLIKRKEILEKILPDEGNVRISTHIVNDGVAFFDAAREKGLEGIVAKHSKSPYIQGKRSRNWLKIKSLMTQDCVVAGFTKPGKSRKHLGSLVLGAFKEGRFVYIGHSGGGFHGLGIKTVYDRLHPLIRESCPFKIDPPDSGTVTWVEPSLVCEVSFTGWTKDGLMRQPNFLRFREDKTPIEAVLEENRVSQGKEDRGEIT